MAVRFAPPGDLGDWALASVPETTRGGGAELHAVARIVGRHSPIARRPVLALIVRIRFCRRLVFTRIVTASLRDAIFACRPAPEVDQLAAF